MSKRLPKLVHVTTVPESLSFFIGQVSYLKRKGIDVYAVSSPGELLKPFLESEQVAILKYQIWEDAESLVK